MQTQQTHVLLPSLPHDEPLERIVLGGLLIGGPFLAVAEHLVEEDWYFRKHQRIYAAMRRVEAASEPIDSVTVARQLETEGVLAEVGGVSYLAELTLGIVSASNLVSHAKAVKELSLLRGLARIGQQLCLGTDAKQPSETLAQEAERLLFTTMWARQVRAWRTSAEVMGETIDHVEAMQRRGGALSGIPTGLTALDQLVGGWQPSDLVILAARPSMGKTGLMCVSALAAAKAGYPVAIASLEMSTRQLGLRLLALEAHVDVFAVTNGRMNAATMWQVSHAAMTIGSLPIHLDDSGLLTLDQLRAKVRQLKIKGQVEVLFVDYLQLMQAKGKRDSRQVEVSEISRGLKLLAKELNITVVALSQLSRKCEEREDKRPILSDLRESGSIEQDADIVIGLYRDEVYHEESLDKGTAELLIRKHRNGPIGDVRVAFLDRSARFADLSA